MSRGPLSAATYASRYLYPKARRLFDSAEKFDRCPWCGAKAGEVCKTPGGLPRFPHEVRDRVSASGS